MNSAVSDQNRKDELRLQVDIWRHNRALYPGWLVAPWQTRAKIWLNTKEWLRPAVQLEHQWTLEEQLYLWREMVWRLEVTLQLLPSNVFGRIKKVVSEAAALHARQEQAYQGTEGEPNLQSSSQSDQENWVACALAVISNERFNRGMGSFENIRSALRETASLSEDQKSHVLYQECLGALAELNREEVFRLLADWPAEPEDPYWLVRKASILLELGDATYAETIALTALERIRGQRLDGAAQYWGLSREAWCMRFLLQISRARRHVPGSHRESVVSDLESSQIRLDRDLETARCSPEVELRALAEGSRRRSPELLPYDGMVSNIPSFDDGLSHSTVYVGASDAYSHLMPAITQLLICDHTGLPPTVLGVSFFRESVKSGLLTTRDHLPGLWAAFALRFGGVGIEEIRDPDNLLTRDSIRRSTLDALPFEQMEHLFQCITRELDRLMDSTTTTNANPSDRRWFGLLADIAAKLSMCLDDQSRERMLKITIMVLENESLRRDILQLKVIWSLVSKVIPFLSVDMVNKYLPELLTRCPISSTVASTRWQTPEVMEFILVPATTNLSQLESLEVRKQIDDLIVKVKTAALAERTAAARRLLRLYQYSILIWEEIAVFREALWEQVDVFGLPAMDDTTSLLIHLDWPREPSHSVEHGLKSWIMGGKIEDRFRSRDQGGISCPMPDPDHYLQELLQLAARLEENWKQRDEIFNSVARQHIIGQMMDWWEREGAHSVGDEGAWWSFRQEAEERLNLTLRVLFSCVLSRGAQPKELDEQISQFVLEVIHGRGQNCYTAQLGAYLIPENAHKFWFGLRDNFWSDDKDLIVDALICYWQWKRMEERLQLPAVPEDILTTVIGILAGGDHEVSLRAYEVVVALVESGELVRDRNSCLLLVNAANGAARKLEQYHHEDGRKRATYAELAPHFRRWLARLLLALRRQGVEIGDRAEGWLEGTRNDRFIDVRLMAEYGERGFGMGGGLGE